MVTDRTGDLRGGRWWRSRSRTERRIIVLGVATVLVVVIPELRTAMVQLLVCIVTLVVLLGFLGILGLAVTWRAARRHPVADLLIGAWLLRRHEHRQQRILDAWSWPRAQQPYEDPGWSPPGARTRHS